MKTRFIRRIRPHKPRPYYRNAHYRYLRRRIRPKWVFRFWVKIPAAIPVKEYLPVGRGEPDE